MTKTPRPAAPPNPSEGGDCIALGSGDLVDHIVGRWRAERPDLDPSGKEVTGRVVRLNGLFQKAYSAGLGDLGLDEGGFAVLVALRRSGEPYELGPTELYRELLISSGGVTHVVDRLERARLVKRRPDPTDRRCVKVALTAAGKRLADKAMTTRAAVEQELVAALEPEERDDLARLLRKLLLSVDK